MAGSSKKGGGVKIKGKVAIKPKFGGGHVPGFLTEKIVATVKAEKKGG